MSWPVFLLSPIEEHEYLLPAYLRLNEMLKTILRSETIKTTTTKTTTIFSIDAQVSENMNEFRLNGSICSSTNGL